MHQCPPLATPLCTTESRNVSASELHVHLPPRCWSISSTRRQTFPGVLSNFQHLLSGTRCDSLFLNPELKLFSSLRFSTCHQRLWSYDHYGTIWIRLLLLLRHGSGKKRSKAIAIEKETRNNYRWQTARRV